MFVVYKGRSGKLKSKTESKTKISLGRECNSFNGGVKRNQTASSVVISSERKTWRLHKNDL